MRNVFLVAMMLLGLDSYGQKFWKRKKIAAVTVADTSKPSSLEAFEKIIKSNSISSKGMISVHKVDDSYYLEIPDSLLGRQLIAVTRIAKAPLAGGIGKNSYYAGDQLQEKVIYFEKSGTANKIFIRGVSSMIRSADSTENGMFRSLLNSSVQPILASFAVKSYHDLRESSLIDVTAAIMDDGGIFGMPGAFKTSFQISSIAPDRSFPKYIKAFTGNLEIRTVKTYFSSQPNADPQTFELNNSLVLLPKVPMIPRLHNPRVGYFSTQYVDFDTNPQGVDLTTMITRWRLEPKEEDKEKYFRGELVEPKKPITFYIDPATPKKWVKYLIQGVNDWQVAFESAGFKNAIFALEAPLNDSTWSIEDASHSAIVYKPSSIANASGPHIHDPRSGEILEAHINWYHNVMSVIRKWYMIQAGAIDPRAGKVEFDEDLMGQLIRFVSSHEIGHTLGLKHNMGASSSVPVDSLRNKAWVERNGHTPSIMDYARFNYVAQPEDRIGPLGIFPRVNDYDKWAIEWGYRNFKEGLSPVAHKPLLDKWIVDRVSRNTRLAYGAEELFITMDPRNTAEDLGNDPMKAGYYGIKNLKRILPQLPAWTGRPHEDYAALSDMYKEVIAQFLRYSGHVINNIGGVYSEYRTVDQKENVYTPVPAKIQRQAVAWLNEEVFRTPKWLLYTPITKNIENSKEIPGVTKAGLEVINGSLGRLRLLVENVDFEAEQYTGNEYLRDLSKEIWVELKSNKNINTYKRALQNEYINALIGYALEAKDPLEELQIIIIPHLKDLKTSILKSLHYMADPASKVHLRLCVEKLDKALYSKKQRD